MIMPALVYAGEVDASMLQPAATSQVMIMIIIINMLMPVQQNSFTHLKVLLVLTDRGILALSSH
jgi:hypothetical protein